MVHARTHARAHTHTYINKRKLQYVKFPLLHILSLLQTGYICKNVLNKMQVKFLNVSSALGLLHCVVVGDAANISDVHATFIFRLTLEP
jgi:hypothetical protein